MRYTNVANRFKMIVAAAEISRCTIHDPHKTFCTDLARLGINQPVVQRLAGHASASTTATCYLRIDDGTKREAITKLTKPAG